ncbi:MAG: phosphoribosylformylglycinamidine synthase subunit PurS [Thermosulfidibacteraceae bacterium]|jgi:phosphoribosylformylglycinamidine synthase
MKIRLIVKLKEGVLDPQGKAVMNSLKVLGFANVSDVRVGKVIDITLDGSVDPKETVDEMCRKLLVNPVIEAYEWYVMEE